MNVLKKSIRAYEEILEQLKEAYGKGVSPENIEVRISAGDVTNNSLFAKVWEECVAGLKYEIIDTNDWGRLGMGTIPLHSVPWNYLRAVEGSRLLTDQIARRLVSNNVGGEILIEGRGHRIEYVLSNDENSLGRVKRVEVNNYGSGLKPGLI